MSLANWSDERNTKIKETGGTSRCTNRNNWWSLNKWQEEDLDKAVCYYWEKVLRPKRYY